MVEVNYAAIDIGTNSVLLLIASQPFHVIVDEARITRLGEGLHQRPVFTEGARTRTLSALEEYAALCKRHRVAKVICAGTSAFRRATDGQAFLKEIGERFGWKIQLLSGEEEARLSYLSVERDFGERHKNLVALDIGGGSTEIISKEGGTSFELGTVILTESILKHDPVSEEEIKKVEATIRNTFEKEKSPPFTPLFVKEGGRGGDFTLVGLAGTVTTLSSVHQKLKVWDPEKIQGSTITLNELDPMISLFRRTTNEERRTIPGMVSGREDTILAGALILKAVMHHLGVLEVVISDRGLRFGLLYEQLTP